MFRIRLALLAALVLLCVPELLATTVTGTIEKPDGTLLNGMVTFTLSQAAHTTGGGPVIYLGPGSPVTCVVNSGAIGGCAVADNVALSPGGTYYIVRGYDLNNRVVWGPIAYQITGSSVDLGSLPMVLIGAPFNVGPAGISIPCVGTVTLYSGGTTYALNNCAAYLGIVYISLHGSNTGNTPSTSPSDWASAGSGGGGGGGGGSVFPVTVSGTVNSGGIPCFTSATNEASSAALAANNVVLGGGAGACPSASTALPNGTTGTTQSPGDNTGKVATDAFVLANAPIPAGSVVPTIVQSGLTAFYEIPATDSPAALTDFSGNGNTGTGTVGSAPTIISGTGGIACGGSGASILPAALNSSRTIQIFVSYQATSDANLGGSQIFSFPVMGNGAGTTAAAGFGFAKASSTGFPVSPFTNGGYFLFSAGFGSEKSQGLSVFNGTGLLSEVIGASVDQLYINGSAVSQITTGTSLGAQTTGGFQLCGTASGFGLPAPFATYFTGNVYAALFYNRALSSAEIATNAAAMNVFMQNRNVPTLTSTINTTDELVFQGDSITYSFASSGASPFTSFLNTLTGTWNISNFGVPSVTLGQAFVTTPGNIASLNSLAAQRNAITIWQGTNDLFFGGTAAQVMAGLATACRTARQGAGNPKCFVATMISRVALDTAKNSLNTQIRLLWPTFADGLIDIAANPVLGADGASATTTWFLVDHVHPNTQADINVIAPIMSRAWASEYGPSDFSSATTYTSGAAAATAITASSESSNTVTITTTLNPPVGACVVITGVTPSGYNSPSGQCWQVLTTGGSSFTYYNGTTGLGAGSVFGVVSAPLEKDLDTRFVTLGGAGAGQNYTLQSCQGRTVPTNVQITDANAWTITPFGSETINGAATLTSPAATASNHSVVVLRPILTSASAAGCTWQASLR